MRLSLRYSQLVANNVRGNDVNKHKLMVLGRWENFENALYL